MFGGGGWLGGVEDLFSAGDVTVNLMELVRFCLCRGNQSFLQALHIDLTVFGWIKNKGDNLIRYSFIKKKTAFKENPGRRGTISLIILIILV